MRLNPLSYLLRLKLFQKVFLVHALIVLAALIAMQLFVSRNVTGMLEDKEIRYNQLVLYNLSTYLEEKADIVMRVAKQSYLPDAANGRAFEFLLAESPTSDEEVSSPDFSRFSAYFNSSFALDKDISGITVYKKTDDTVYSFSRYHRRAYLPSGVIAPEKLAEAGDPQPKIRSFPAYRPLDDPASLDYTLSVNLRTTDSLQPIGSLFVDFDTLGIRNAVSRYYEDILGDVRITTADGALLFDSSGNYDIPLPPTEDYIVNEVRNDRLNLTLTGLLPKKEMLRKIGSTRRAILYISAASMLAALFLTFFSVSFFSGRVRSVISSMRALREGDFSHRIPVTRYKDEMDEVAVSFNNMYKNLQLYIEKVYISEIKEKNAQLKALQSQINPHFLYNTLEAVRMKAIAEGAQETGRMVLILSKLFRNTVKETPTITVEEEIKQLKLYLELFRIRHEGRLNVVYEVEDDLLPLAMPRHLLQPIVENYVLHGYDGRNEDNRLWIRALRDHEMLRFEIRDNGSGISSDTLDSLRQELQNNSDANFNGIGLANVHQRIRLIYGESFGLEIESGEQEGTIIRISLRAWTKKELEANVQSFTRR